MLSAKLIGTYVPPIHREGWPFIGAAAAGALILWAIASPLGWIGALVTIGVAAFFRDPDRVPPPRSTAVLSPADGVIVAVDRAAPPVELGLGDTPRPRIAIFLSILDVHINRMPVKGTVRRLGYRRGTFINASFDKASVDNERQSLLIVTPSGVPVAVVQIAGLIARRIRCWVREGQAVEAGERFGLIRFGSRAEVYLPDGVEPLVAVGQRSIGGETVLAELSGEEIARDPGPI